MTIPLSSNMYGVHPRLTVLDRNGDAYGLLFLNSAAQVNSETGSGKSHLEN
jgi:hypothetical protein